MWNNHRNGKLSIFSKPNSLNPELLTSEEGTYDGTIVVIIDGFELLRPCTERLQDGIGWLLHHCPPQVRIVIGGNTREKEFIPGPQMIKLGVFVPSQSESLLGLFIQSKAEDATPIGSENKERLGSLGSVCLHSSIP